MINSNILVPNIDDLTYHEWLEVRRSGLGGSDVAAALGVPTGMRAIGPILPVPVEVV